MAGSERRDDRVKRVAHAALTNIGLEIRQARLNHDLSQSQAAAAIGKSNSAWSRIERGESPKLPLLDLALAAAVVGLDLNVRAYPGGSPVRDRAHLALLERLRALLEPTVGWRTEVALPNPGDRRAWDALVSLPSMRIGVEAETKVRDAQELQRRLSLKRRDGGVDHLILLLANTRHNRAFLRMAGRGFLADFPVPGATALARLSAAEDPLGSSIVLL